MARGVKPAMRGGPYRPARAWATQAVMSFKDTHENRAAKAAEAKRKLMERFRAQPGPDDPAVIARLAEQKAAGEARAQRQAEARARAEAKAAAAAAAKAEAEAAKQREAEEATRIAAEAKRKAAELLIEQKAARDARYAARKAKKR
jgi:multidrug efflux pump subunit AcrB